MRTQTSVTGRHRPRRSPAAFTLLELLVVLTLIVVLAGIIVPRMDRSVKHRELREAAARFALTARTVRELAVAQGRVCALEVDLDRGYRVATPSGGDQSGQWQGLRASWLKAQRWPKTVTVDSYRTPDGTAPVDGTQYLKFFPDGTSGGAAIRLAGSEGAYKIIVHPHSGRVFYGDARTAESDRDWYDLGD